MAAKRERKSGRGRGVPAESDSVGKGKSAARNDEQASGFPIVCIGSSAGGLEALRRFFESTPASSGLAYVLISHLDPNHVSMLPELMQAVCKDPVKQIEDGMVVEPNMIYVIPPDRELTIVNGRLRLLPQNRQAGPRLAIDNFLRALAVDQKENAICIILSGAGSDGTLGLREVRRESGMIMVQDPETAQFGSMPRSAIQTNLADYILPPEEMPEQLLGFVKMGAAEASVDRSLCEDILTHLEEICGIIRRDTGHDFSSYKQNTICRRIERRLKVHQLEHAEDYVRFLTENPEEVTVLFQELLIGVTSFFRDPDNFDSLKENVLLDIVRNKSERSTIRIWTPGCSTGEEAFSVAILLQECMDQLKKHVPVQIFATDIDDSAISHARQARFPAAIKSDVCEERLRRYFILENDAFVLKKDVRGMLTFATHNILKDPPFGRLDLICCRNLMIYLDNQAQKRLVSIFHYSLLPGGFLYLGGSESISGATDLFATIDQKHKVFQRRLVDSSRTAIQSFPAANDPSPRRSRETATQDVPVESGLIQSVERHLLETYAPASVVVDSKGEVVYVIQGDTGKYLDLAHGSAQLNVLKMAKRGIRSKLTTTLNRAVVGNKRVALNGVKLKHEGRSYAFNLIVDPISAADVPHGLYLIVFDKADTTVPPAEVAVEDALAPDADSRVLQLEEELRNAREDLQATMEVMESSNEELKSANEELQSLNEELQSSNEELVTSKEEMQSLNEELSTVNAENEARINDMTKAFDDIRNLLNCTPFATVFVDCELRIRRFTPMVTQIMNFIDADMGRPLADITSQLDYDGMVQDVELVLKSLEVCEKEVRCKDGRSYIMRILPYRTVANVIDGAVIAFIDVTERKTLSLLTHLYASVLQSAQDVIMMIELDGAIVVFNQIAEDLYGWSREKTKSINIRSLTREEDWNGFAAAMERVHLSGKSETLEVTRVTEEGKKVHVLTTLRRVEDENGAEIGLACVERLKENKRS